MDYLLSFLEGIITFISPCLLPLIPVYASFFAGQQNENTHQRALFNAAGFVLGFTALFVLMGAFAGAIGNILKEYSVFVNIAAGIIIVLFGLHFIGFIRLPLLNQSRKLPFWAAHAGFLSSFIFGIVFSVGWTPCAGVFLGSALMLAASRGESVKGILMLLCFSSGLGIPFILSAVLIDRLKTSFAFIKSHYRAVNLVSGGFLVVIGLMLATGLMGYFLSLLTF